MTRPARNEFVPRGDSESPSERETEIRRRSVRRAEGSALGRGDGRCLEATGAVRVGLSSAAARRFGRE